MTTIDADGHPAWYLSPAGASLITTVQGSFKSAPGRGLIESVAAFAPGGMVTSPANASQLRPGLAGPSAPYGTNKALVTSPLRRISTSPFWPCPALARDTAPET